MDNGIINLPLPYQTQSVNTFMKQFFSEAKEHTNQSDSAKDDFLKRLTGATKQSADEILATFFKDVLAIPGYLAACLSIGNAQGYESQTVIIQQAEGFFIRQKWNDVLKSNSIEKSVKIDIDLRKELLQLRRENWILRSAEGNENRNIDLKNGMEGRYVTLYIAAGLESEWLMCRNLLLHGEYSNNALNRILRVIGEVEEKVTLV